MRQFKFRLWSKREKRFINPENICWGHYYESTGNAHVGEYGKMLIDFNGELRIAVYPCGNGDNAADSVFDNLADSDNYIIQQYIGLKDRNNNEVYEGDFLSGRTNPIVVEYDPPEFRFIYNNPDKNSWLNRLEIGWADFEGEVIGNILENPELC